MARKTLTTILLAALLVAGSAAQQDASKPQVKVNMLNVCTPSAEDQKEFAQALQKIPRQPLFGVDFEVSRGRSTLDQSPSFLKPGSGTHMVDDSATASYVRIRREFSVQATFGSVQYSFSNDGQNMVETLVLHARDPKDLIQVSMEDSAAASVSPAVMLEANTPATRVRLERFGKPSAVLARCAGTDGAPPVDQSAYEPLFRSASDVLASYRRVLGVSALVPTELGKLSPARPAAANTPKTSVTPKK